MLAGMMAAGAGSAAAQTFTCAGTLPPAPSGSWTAVNVRMGATCNVAGSGNVTVSGPVTVGSGATLADFGTATFTAGSLSAVGAKTIYLVPAAGGGSSQHSRRRVRDPGNKHRRYPRFIYRRHLDGYELDEFCLYQFDGE